MTFTARSRGVLPFVSSQDCSFATGNSCEVVGASTVVVRRVAGPTSANAKPDFLNSAMARAAASYNDSAATATVCVKPEPSVNETLQELGTVPA